jgi:hypothetical protein
MIMGFRGNFKGDRPRVKTYTKKDIPVRPRKSEILFILTAAQLCRPERYNTTSD